MSHSLALIAVALIAIWAEKDRVLKLSGIAFSMGILLFSGSLYLLVLMDNSALGIITPFGGLFFLVGWVLFVIAAAQGNLSKR